MHAVADLPGWDLDLGDVSQLLNDALQNLPAEVSVHHLASAKLLGDLHLVPRHEELVCSLHADGDVVRVDLDGASQPNLLHFRGFGLGACPLLLLGFLVAVLAVVHDSADRRTGMGRDLDEVQFRLLSESVCLLKFHDADLVVVFVDEPDRRDADLPVHTELLGGRDRLEVTSSGDERIPLCK